MHRRRLSSIVVALLCGGVTFSGAEAGSPAAGDPAPLPPARPSPGIGADTEKAPDPGQPGEPARSDEGAREDGPNPAAADDDDAADDADDAAEMHEDGAAADDDDADDDDDDDDGDDDGDGDGDGDGGGGGKATAASPDDDWTIRRVLEKTTGLPVSGNVTVQLKSRWSSASDSDSDSDLYTFLSLHVGSETKDRVSATFSTRASWDLDGQDGDGYVFSSLADTYDSRLNARVYMGYVAWRPEGGPVEIARAGRQYVDVAETFHIDGVHAESRVLAEKIGLRASVFGGVPVHLYESQERGDWLAGFQVSAEPAKGTRVAVDYTHVEDDLDFLGQQHDNLVGLSAWQSLDVASLPVELHGRVTHLDVLRDATLRATVRVPDRDLMVQASYFRLFDQKNEYSTEFDPYFSVLHGLREYQQGRLRAVKGFGDDIVVEAGTDIRRMADSASEGAFNHDATRIYVLPSFDNVPWEGSTLTFIGEQWNGNGTKLDTYGGDLTHRWGDFKLTVGTDYSLYALGPLGDREREHVRRYYVRGKYEISDDVSLDVRLTREDDDEETFHLLSIALSYDF